tara:strand:+ start:344072 stop:346369 length:2298 start_codon:yes stop_codon:yes gene_type:complete
MIRFLFLLMIMCVQRGFGQTVIIKDSLLNKPITNANISSNSFGVISNSDGKADLSLFKNNEVIVISHVSYKRKNIIKEALRDSIIYLKQMTNILPDIVLTENNKTPLSKKYPVFTIKPKGVNLIETSSADLIASTSSVVVQESQAGGGSPNYRGMEANRLLLIVDGVMLNNTIYRSGHVQSSSTINPFFIKSIDLLSGPSSVAYGSGAMGGALIFNTADPIDTNQLVIRQIFESSNNAVTTNLLGRYYSKKISQISGFSIKSADNLRMGSNRLHGYKNWGNEGGATLNNEQLFTNYYKADFIHKIKYQIDNRNQLLSNTQFSISSDVYRFDKMNDLDNGELKYLKWYYGPQIRFLQKVEYLSGYKSFLFNSYKLSLAYQNIKESRHKQKREDLFLSNRYENVKIYDANLNFNKSIGASSLVYGGGVRFQEVFSTASLTSNFDTLFNTTRYPDGGSDVTDLFLYSQMNIPINNLIDVFLGARWNGATLNAKFNESVVLLENVENKNNSFVKSMVLSYQPTNVIKINFGYYNGFRNPNIDDIGKVFSKDGDNVVLPNSNLNPEYSNNFELTIDYSSNKIKGSIQLFRTEIENAIVREYGDVNGVDSILYDGEMMRIQLNQNISSATINGFSANSNLKFSRKISLETSINYIVGVDNNNNPLAHIPPLNGRASINYKNKNYTIGLYTIYNHWKFAEDFDAGGIDNLDEATIDGVPSWYTLNIGYTQNITENTTFMMSVKNLTDVHYKTFGSGISASGINFVIGLNTSF